MASQKFGFITIDPVSGQGATAVNISGDKHTGRLARSKTFNASAEGVSAPKVLTVNQAAAAENITVTSATATVAKEGGTVTITGKSNSTKLGFAVNADSSNPLNLVVPANYTAAGKQTANNAVIADDPGATAEFDWSVTFSGIAANTTIEELIATLTITAAGGQTKSVTITQAAGDPYIELDKETINLDVNGTVQTVNVDTNTKFTFSEAVAKAMRAMFRN